MTPVMSLFLALESHLLMDDNPSLYLSDLCGEPIFQTEPFSMLFRLKETEQSPKHHPEGSVWNHTMLVVEEAAKRKRESSNPRAFLWAALLHDIGKPDTTKIRKGKLTSYDHDIVGETLAGNFLSALCDDRQLIETVCGLVRYHMQFLFVINDLPYADIDGMKKRCDTREVALLGLCDRLGRLNCDREAEEANRRLFLHKCR